MVCVAVGRIGIANTCSRRLVVVCVVRAWRSNRGWLGCLELRLAELGLLLRLHWWVLVLLLLLLLKTVGPRTLLLLVLVLRRSNGVHAIGIMADIDTSRFARCWLTHLLLRNRRRHWLLLDVHVLHGRNQTTLLWR